MITFKHFSDHPPYELLWSLFPFLMWIAFLVMPGSRNREQPRSKLDKAISLIVGLAVLGFVGYEIYQYVITH